MKTSSAIPSVLVTGAGVGRSRARVRALKPSIVMIAAAAILLLGAGAARRAPAGYEIELRMTGYTGLATSKDCDNITDPNGYDVLTGVVREVVDGSEDVTYTGTLIRTTKIDYCLTVPNPTPDQLRWCVARLTASARMDVEITVYGEHERGAWVKAEPSASQAPFATPTVQGDCDASDMAEIRQDYPSGDSGGSPSGQPIRENPANPMFANGLARLRVGGFPPKPPETLWSLQVIRAVP